MTNMVAGFLFDNEKNSVLLIRKERPDWQKGSLNGIGGKIELGESPLEAIIREFQEETGLQVLGWKQFCTLHGDGDDHNEAWEVHFFYTFEDIRFIIQTRPSCDEGKIVLFQLGAVRNFQRIPNLDWLISMALSMDHERAAEFDIMEIK